MRTGAVGLRVPQQKHLMCSQEQRDRRKRRKPLLHSLTNLPSAILQSRGTGLCDRRRPKFKCRGDSPGQEDPGRLTGNTHTLIAMWKTILPLLSCRNAWNGIVVFLQ